MIVPLGASTIARTAPTTRVRRRDRAGSAAVGVSADEIDGEPVDDDGARPAFVAPAAEQRERRSGASRPAASFLGALLTLRRGG